MKLKVNNEFANLLDLFFDNFEHFSIVLYTFITHYKILINGKKINPKNSIVVQ